MLAFSSLAGSLVFDGTASVGKQMEPTMAEQRMATIKAVQGRLLFTRSPVGTESLEPEPARIDFDRLVGPLFPFTHRRRGSQRHIVHTYQSADIYICTYHTRLLYSTYTYHI